MIFKGPTAEEDWVKVNVAISRLTAPDLDEATAVAEATRLVPICCTRRPPFLMLVVCLDLDTVNGALQDYDVPSLVFRREHLADDWGFTAEALEELFVELLAQLGGE